MDLNVLAPILEPLGLDLQSLGGYAALVFAIITALKVRFPVVFVGKWVDAAAIVLSAGVAALQFHALGVVTVVVGTVTIYFGSLFGQGLLNKIATGDTRGEERPTIKDKRANG